MKTLLALLPLVLLAGCATSRQYSGPGHYDPRGIDGRPTWVYELLSPELTRVGEVQVSVVRAEDVVEAGRRDGTVVVSYLFWNDAGEDLLFEPGQSRLRPGRGRFLAPDSYLAHGDAPDQPKRIDIYFDIPQRLSRVSSLTLQWSYSLGDATHHHQTVFHRSDPRMVYQPRPMVDVGFGYSHWRGRGRHVYGLGTRYEYSW